MAPTISLTKFVNAALYNTGPHALSYPHHAQKWIIRDHILSLLRDFPSLSPSIDTFIHNDGTSVHLLNAHGCLQASPNSPPIPVTIWVHQSYPFEPPLVFLSSTPGAPVLAGHPFVDPSGAAASPYLLTWLYPQSNLSDLTRNLVHIFSHHPPLPISSSPSCSLDKVSSGRGSESDVIILRTTSPSRVQPFVLWSSGNSLASKREAIDRLVGALHYDMVSLQEEVGRETDELLKLQGKLAERGLIISALMSELNQVETDLKQMVMKIQDQVDVLRNWLKVNDSGFGLPSDQGDSKEAFEPADKRSRQVLESAAMDWAIGDVVEVLDRAVETGSLSLGAYLKQIRALAKEQFFHRAMLVTLRSFHLL